MSYRGMFVDIPLGLGGFDGNMNTYQIDPRNLAEAVNVSYRDDAIVKAPGFDAVDDTGVGASRVCFGGHDWRPTTALQYQVTAWDNGSVYRESGDDLDAATLGSGYSFTEPVHFITGGHLSLGGDRLLYMYSRNQRPQQVAGSTATFSNLTADSPDWSSNYPAAATYHDARVVAYGLDNAPHTYYFSSLLDHGDFSLASGARVRSVFPGEGDEISSIISFGGTVMYVFKYPYGIYRIDTLNITSYAMPAERVRDDVGAAGPGAVLKVGADVYFVSGNGRLYSLASLNPDADTRDADLTATFNVDSYIDENFDKTRRKWVKLQYNELTKELFYFFTSLSSANEVNDRALVFNLESQTVRIAKYEQGEYFNAAWRYIDSSNEEALLVGGYGGKIFNINSPNKNVDGAAFTSTFEIPETDLRWVSPKLQGMNKRFDMIELTMVPSGAWDATLTFIVDGQDAITRTIDLSDSDAAFDVAVYDTGQYAGSKVIKKRIPINAWGETIACSITGSGLNEDFKFINARYYFKPEGQLYESA